MGHDWCSTCKSLHAFDRLQSACIIGFLPCIGSVGIDSSDEGAVKSSLRCIQKSDINTLGIGCLLSDFDLGVICIFVKYWSRVNGSFYAKDEELSMLRNKRNDCFHVTSMGEELFEDTFATLVRICRIIRGRVHTLHPGTAFPDFDLESSITSCKKELSRLDVIRLYEDQILREIKRTYVRCLKQHLTESFVARITTNSLDMAEWLCGLSDGVRILIVPKLNDNADVSKAKVQADFLTYLPWTVVLDLNTEPVWNENDNFALAYTTVMSDLSISLYGYDRMLYTRNRKNAVHFACEGVRLAVVVVGFDSVSLKKEDLKSLEHILYMFRGDDHDEVENLIEVKPIFEKVDFMVNTKALWTLDSVDEAMLQAPHNVLSWNVLSHYVYGQKKTSSLILLPATSAKGTMIGFPSKKILPYSKCVDILTIDCADYPWYVPVEFGEEEVDSDDVINKELGVVLSYKPLSWYLFRHEKAVRRRLLTTVIDEIREKKVVTVEHELRAGVSTICRHALYELRREFVCVELKDDIQHSDVGGVVDMLKEIFDVTGLKILILLDFKHNSGDIRAINIRNQLETRGTRFWVLLQTRKTCHSTTTLPRGEVIIPKDGGGVSWNLTSEEAEGFRKLLPDRRIFHGEIDLSAYLTGHGFLNVNSLLKRDRALVDSICRTPDHVLLANGFWASDIQILRGDSEMHYSQGISSLISIGLLGFVDDYYSQAEEYVIMLLEKVDKELSLLKLLVFYALFAPAAGLNFAVAGFLLQGEVYKGGNIKLSAVMQFFVDVDVRLKTVRIKMPKLAYILADSPKVFGPKDKWGENVSKFLHTMLLPLLGNDPYRDIITHTADAMVAIFSTFKVWHPHDRRCRQDMRYSFLIELMLSVKGNVEPTINAAARVASLFVGHKEHIALATQAARLITNKAFEKLSTELLDHARECLDAIENGYNFASVSDRYGNLYKTKLRILGSPYYPKNGEKNDEFQRRKSVMTMEMFDNLLQVAEEAIRCFQRAARQSAFFVPHPLVATAQVYECLLSVAKHSIFSGDAGKFYSAFEENAVVGIAFQEYSISKLRNLNVFSEYLDNLIAAKRTLQYISPKGSQFSGEFSSSLGTRSTQSLIADLHHKLKAYRCEEPIRYSAKPVRLNLEMSKLLWLRSANLNCEELTYCLLSSAQHLQKSGDASRHYYALELLVNVSNKLSVYDHASGMLREFFRNMDIPPEDKETLVNIWEPGNNLEKLLEAWIVVADNELKHESVPPRVGKVLLHLWKMFEREESSSITEDNLQLKNALRSLQSSGKIFRNCYDSRLFLKPACSIAGNPFSCFCKFEDLDFGDQLLSHGILEAREEVYVQCGGRVLRECFGTICKKEHLNARAFVKSDLDSEGAVEIFIDDRIIRSLNLELNSRIVFFLALSDVGLKAHGVRAIE